MQRTSLVCSSNPIFILPTFHPFPPPSASKPILSLLSSFLASPKLPTYRLSSAFLCIRCSRSHERVEIATKSLFGNGGIVWEYNEILCKCVCVCTDFLVHVLCDFIIPWVDDIASIELATQEIVETSKSESEFVEVGYLSSVHGLQGEICVKPNTGFPELRFSQPGRRWLRQQVLGRETIQEVELIEGREHHGRKSWILLFEGIDTVEQAKPLVGSTLLAREGDRPELEEDEFYTHDLVGMKVIMKETGELVGTVVNVFNSGANDLLYVMLHSSVNLLNGSGKARSPETEQSGHLVWIPFVEEIVPNVDMNRREMQITPPKGLLELNLRFDEKSKKERRQLEWKERKKFQKRLIAAKKKLCEMEQQHVFHGFRFGEKSHTSLLADQIVGVNSKLLQQALQNIEKPSKRWNVTEVINATRTNAIRSTLKISEGCIIPGASKEKVGAHFNLLEKGHNLVSEGKIAMVLVVNDSERQGRGSDPDSVDSGSTENKTLALIQTLLFDDQRLVKMEDRASVPLVLICPSHEIKMLEKIFLDNDYFSFDSKKVWFLEEENLPVVSSSNEEQNKHKILMKSPWEILQLPVGSGGLISLLSSNDIAENLKELGVEYVEICSTSGTYIGGNSMFLGFVNSCKADIGIRISEDSKHIDESFNLIFSTNFLKKLVKQTNKLQFYAIPKPNSHVEKVDKEWIDVIPSTPNSYELRSSIYSCLNSCSLDKVCVMEITE
ncbi:hypothetical protein Pint_10081 [Pistacia integerrima]|uniref:Uncharacterized protein n=1 Tax=Pistacia integerrima TaxID=434235 RepID=A0ACC0XMN4_9ROSI|nr:hypothetical protein Pint_10081 [Pistacia integerrima]